MQSTFAPLCWRVSVAASVVAQSAARTFWNLLAAIDMPMPVLHMSTPKSASPVATSFATAMA